MIYETALERRPLEKALLHGDGTSGSGYCGR